MTDLMDRSQFDVRVQKADDDLYGLSARRVLKVRTSD